jgi:hypothetical protein
VAANLKTPPPANQASVGGKPQTLDDQTRQRVNAKGNGHADNVE